mmetsp:Transcript_15396/g.22876  ORF Transcript_15396/g.22876 Transcript_15396/m.22876 type:complete len:138 (-) Transcript_15396:18-431(-)
MNACLVVILFLNCLSFSIGFMPQMYKQKSKPFYSLPTHKINIEHEGQNFEFEIDENTTVLEGALENGIDLPHDCKLGVCLTCPGKIISGESDQSGSTLEQSVIDKGYTLTCSLYPKSDMVVKTIDENELVNAQFEKF